MGSPLKIGLARTIRSKQFTNPAVVDAAIDGARTAPDTENISALPIEWGGSCLGSGSPLRACPVRQNHGARGDQGLPSGRQLPAHGLI
jgi:hypothetical protein